MRSNSAILILLTGLSLFNCKSYKQNILFKTDEATEIAQTLSSEDSNKKIQIGDYLELEVFTKFGEKIIDPDYELATSTNPNSEKLRPKLKYLVRNDGSAKLPMIGDVYLEGITLNEAEELLQAEYEEFYHNTFVNLNFLNKRVIILGSPGGKVVPIDNENTRLVEVIALADGIDNFGNGHNIRVLRGDQVFIADLSTIEGYQKGNILVEPGDIIYIEPIRRPFSEFMRDNGPVVASVASVISLVVLLISVNN